MCISCFSNGEVWAANAMMAGGLGSQVAGRFRLGRSTPEQRRQRRQEAWDRDAAFLAGLGLDPEAHLRRRPPDLPS